MNAVPATQLADVLNDIWYKTGQNPGLSLANIGEVQASYTTATGVSNADLTFTAVGLGPAGNGITVAYVNPSANSQPLLISVVGTAISVSLATGSGGAITSTGSSILAAIQANPAASALVTVALATGNSGAGVVTAFAATNLAGGAGNDSLRGQFTAILNFVNATVRKYWRLARWPETMCYEQRFFAPVFDYYTMYLAGTVIYDPFTNAYWLAALDSTAYGQSPTTAPTYWTAIPLPPPVPPAIPAPPLVQTVIPLNSPNRVAPTRLDITGISTGEGSKALCTIATASGAVALGTVWELFVGGKYVFAQFLPLAQAAIGAGFTQKPNDWDGSTNNNWWVQIPPQGLNETPIGYVYTVDLLNQLISGWNNYGNAQDKPFRLVGGNVWVLEAGCYDFPSGNPPTYPTPNINSVWVEFQSRVPTFTFAPYVSGTGYAIGQVAYWQGDDYMAINTVTATANQDPTSQPQLWQLVPFPETLREPVVMLCWCLWMAQAGTPVEKGATVTAVKGLADEALEEAFTNLTVGESQHQRNVIMGRGAYSVGGGRYYR